MKQKIISLVALSLFFGIFGYFFGVQYWDFQQTQKKQDLFYSENTKQIETFSLDDLSGFGDETELHMTPNLSLQERIISQMDAAREKILVEVYIFTEKQMREALLRAHKRGVKVQVLLENNPYQAPHLNDDTFEILESAGIDVRWSDPLLYSLNHSKLLIIDERAYISTGNFSYSLFAHNKDFLLEFQKPDIVQDLKSLFLLDFSHEVGGVLHPNLVVSPYNSRHKLEFLLQRAQKNIDFYFPYLQDERLEEILFEKAQGSISIRGIVEKDFYDKNTDLVQRYREKGIILRPLKKNKLHAKMILVDGKYMYLGSINFSKYSMDTNREMGVLLGDTNHIRTMQKIFERDF